MLIRRGGGSRCGRNLFCFAFQTLFHMTGSCPQMIQNTASHVVENLTGNIPHTTLFGHWSAGLSFFVPRMQKELNFSWLHAHASRHRHCCSALHFRHCWHCCAGHATPCFGGQQGPHWFSHLILILPHCWASQTTAGLFPQCLPGCKARGLPLLHSGTPSAPCTTRQALRARSVTAPDLVARISGDIVAL